MTRRTLVHHALAPFNFIALSSRRNYLGNHHKVLAAVKAMAAAEKRALMKDVFALVDPEVGRDEGGSGEGASGEGGIAGGVFALVDPEVGRDEGGSGEGGSGGEGGIAGNGPCS